MKRSDISINCDFQWHGKEAIEAIERGIIKSLHEIGLLISSDAKLLAAVDTGLMRVTINFQVDDENMEVIIFVTVEYAPHVEYGTENMKAQPFMRQAFYNNRYKIVVIFQKNLKGL